MKNLLNKIKDINQILLFLTAILFIVMVSKDFVRNLFKHSYQQESIRVVDSNKSPENNVKPSYEVDFEEKIKDTFIFKVKTKVIDNAVEHTMLMTKAVENFSSRRYSYGSYFSDNTVNLIFVNADGKKRVLLEKDALITNFGAANFEDNQRSDKVEKNIYLIIHDSNNDEYLDEKDQQDLYVSSYNGENLTLVLKDVAYYRVIEDNLLLIQQRGTNGKFYTYKINDSLLAELDTQISSNASKKIQNNPVNQIK